MSHSHDHHHHHHAGEEPRAEDVAPDAAGQSLADALRASFRILKAIMFLLIVVFLCSGITTVRNSEEALVFRFGRLRLNPADGKPYGPGLLTAFPYPIDERIRVPTRQRTTRTIWAHWFNMRDEDRGKPLGELAGMYSAGLDPAKDGALLTADHGLVHVKWTLTYRIDDLARYVRTVADGVEGEQDALVTVLLENAAIKVVSTYTAEEVTRSKTAAVAREVMTEVNAALDRLDTGIRVESLEPEPTVPLSTLSAFSEVTKAENEKGSRIQEANKQANELLAQTTGGAQEYLAGVLDLRDAALRVGDAEKVAKLEAALGRTFDDDASHTSPGQIHASLPAAALADLRDALSRWTAARHEGRKADADALAARIDHDPGIRVSGEAGSRISAARSFYTRAVQGIEGDVANYQAHLVEYQRNPALLVNRLWEQTKQKLLTQAGVTKIGIPRGAKEVRIIVGPDPRQKELDEIEKLKKEVAEKGKTIAPG